MGNQNIDRRSFLKGAAATAATVIGSNLASGTQLAANAAAAQSDNSNAETHGSGRSSEKIIARPGSDFMVDVIKARASSTSLPIRDRASAVCRSRSSTTATTRSRNFSLACTRNRRWPWPMATPRQRASRWA